MAARHPFPSGQYPDLRVSKEPDGPPTIPRKPFEVSFRNGKDLKKLAEELVGRYVVKVTAAVGSGKSTVLPRELCGVMGSPVVHVFPSRVLAVAQYDYLSALGTGVEYKLSLSNTDEYSASGVTLTYSAAVWARVLAIGISNNPLGKAILYLDESHESDAYTYSLQKIAHVISGVQSVVFSSANHDVEKLPMRETLGSVESRKFPSAERTNSWDPLDMGKPWSISEFESNALLYVESHVDAKVLVGKYNKAGVTAYRLTADMDIELFREAMRAMHDNKRGIIVLIADYSFRSGFTFNVSTIVDSAVVGYYDVREGSQSRKYRPAYSLERYQAQGRAGRTPGSHCVCWYPDVKVEDILCRLEGVEIDIAAVLFRMAGFAPHPEIRTASFAIGKVPKDLVHSLNNSMALVMQPASAMCDLVHVSSSVADENHAKEMAEVVASYVQEQEPNMPNLFRSLNLTGHDTSVIDLPDPNVALKQLMYVAVSASCIIPPAYYMVPGLECVTTDTRYYGDDWKMALDELQRQPLMAKGLSDQDVKEVVVLLLNAYNLTNATVVGLTRVAMHKDAIARASATYPNQVKNWVFQVGERLRVSECTRNALADALNLVLPSTMHFSRVDPFRDVEEKVMASYAQELVTAVNAAASKIDTTSYAKGMIERVANPDFRVLPDGGVHLLEGGSQDANVRLIPVHVGKRRTYNILVKPHAPAGWMVRDYVDVMLRLLQHKNINPSSVSDLLLPNGVNDRDKAVILDKVRAVRIKRSESQYVVKTRE